MIRLDKLLSDMGYGTRSEISKAIRGGACEVDGAVTKDASAHIGPNQSVIKFRCNIIEYREHIYIMLNKPAEVVSATEDAREKTVIDLLEPRLKKVGLFPCGRLDKDTLGLLILTNDGEMAHRKLSPKHHATKVYSFRCEKELTDDVTTKFAGGITLTDGTPTRPAQLKIFDDRLSGEITLTEGKYHEIKRMFEAVDNKIIFLERIAFAGLTLDPTLTRGQWRYLTAEEEKLLK